MNKLAQWQSRPQTPAGAGHPLRDGMAGAAGRVVMVVALVAATALAVVFAATLAVVMALATALLALAALAWRVKPRSQAALARTRSGHAWVAYGWDRRRG